MSEVVRGSEWRKWDLHLHCYNTHLNNQYVNKITEEEYYRKIEESNVQVFGITDYFTSINIEKTINKFKKTYPNSNKTFFYNIEFRLNEDCGNGHVNVHLIFDKSVSSEKIKNFLSSIKLKEKKVNGAQKTINDLISENDFEAATVELEEIKNKLEQSFGTTDKPCMLCVPISGYGSIRAKDYGKNGKKRSSIIGDEIDKNCNFFFCPNSDSVQIEDERNYALHKIKDKEGKLVKRYEGAAPKAVVRGSDAHEIDDIGKFYTWIKADTTFSGLKQIVFEPEERVSLSINKPETKSPYLVIDRIEYEKQSQPIYLSENLNTIIGGRGTGKSTFLSSIAYKLGNEQKAIDFQQFNHNDYIPLDFKIFWKDGVENDERAVEYIPQGYMYRLADKEEGREELDSLVRGIIKDKGKDNDIQQYDSEVRKNQSDLLSELKYFFENKVTLNSLIKPEGDIEGIRNNIELLSNEKNEILKKKNFSEDENNDFQKQKNEIQKLENDNDIIETQVIPGLDNLKSQNLINDFIAIEQVDEETRDELQKFIDNIENEVKEKWIRKLEEIKTQKGEYLAANRTQIENIKGQEVYKKGIAASENDQILGEKEHQLSIENRRLSEHISHDNKEKEFQQAIKENQQKIIDLYNKYSAFRKKLASNFTVPTFNDKLKIEVSFSHKNFDEVLQYLDARNATNRDFKEKFNNHYDLSEIIETIFDDCAKLTFNQQKDSRDFLNDIFTNIWYVYHFDLKYDGEDFEQMSPGKKSFVVLNLLLDFSDDEKPVLIDQPEDNLDNRAIYDELTAYLKKKKKERQIIVVTHNPNVVVGADSENIIIANQNSYDSPNRNKEKFEYTNGALECSMKEDKSISGKVYQQGIREHVIEILEGGLDALEKRERKYSLKE